MNRIAEKISVNLVGAFLGLSAYVFWAASYNTLHFFVLQIYQTMTEPWFLAFVILGAVLLHLLNTFAVFLAITAAYIFFMAWPNIEIDQLLLNISDPTGEVTVGSVLLSRDAFRTYAMLIAIAFCDVLNLAHVRTKEGETL